MSLKGYEWLIDGKVVMSFRFKYLELDIWEDIKQKDLDEFIQYLKDQGRDKVIKINYNGHKVK